MERSSTIFHQRILRYLTVLVAFVISFSTAGHELETSHPRNNGNHKQEVTVAITHGDPPFYTLNGDGGSEWQLIKSALAEIEHHTSRPLYIPLSQAMDLYNRRVVDAIWLSQPSNNQGSEHWYLSDPLLKREFVAITLTQNDLAITTPDDLNALDVGYVSCVKALLPEALQPPTSVDPAFQVCKSDTLMLLMLYENRLDVAIGERSSFEYYREKLPQSVHKNQPVTYHNIYPAVSPRLVFYDSILRDEFNEALRKVRKNKMSRRTKAETGLKSSSGTKHR